MMLLRKTKFSFLFSSLLFLGACGSFFQNNKENENIIRYPLSIITFNNISNDGKLPSDIFGFCLPIESRKKIGKFYIPDESSILLKIDTPVFKASIFCKSPLNSVQNAANVIDSSKITTGVSNYLNNLHWDSIAIKGTYSPFKKMIYMGNYLSKENKSLILTYSSDPDFKYTGNMLGYKVYHNLDSIRNQINKLFEESNSGSKISKRIIIIYEPPIIDSTPNPPPPPPPPPGDKQKPRPKITTIHKILKIDCGKYDGDTYNDTPEGVGTLYYSQPCRISPYDNKERMTEAGDYITGHWKNGYLDVGTWYDKNGKEKAVLTIGVPQQ